PRRGARVRACGARRRHANGAGPRVNAPRHVIADDLMRRLAAALRASQLYSPGHPIIARNMDAWSAAIDGMHRLQPSIVVGLVGDEVIVDETPLASAEAWVHVIRRLQQSGVERVTIVRGVTHDELGAFVAAVAVDRGLERM